MDAAALEDPGFYTRPREEEHVVQFSISASTPLSVVDRYGLQERAARRQLVRCWGQVLHRRIERQEKQLVALRGAHRSFLGREAPGAEAEAVAEWGMGRSSGGGGGGGGSRRGMMAPQQPPPRGVVCWRTAAGMRQAAVAAAKRSRVDWQAVQREVGTASWLKAPAVPTATAGGNAAVIMPRGTANKLLGGATARDLRRQVDSIRAHVKAKPLRTESMELGRLLDEAMRLEVEVARLDKQLLIACHALELHFAQQPDPIDEAAGVTSAAPGARGGERRRLGPKGDGEESSSPPPSPPQQLGVVFNHEVDQSNAARGHGRSSARAGSDASSAHSEAYYRRHARAVERRRARAGPLHAPRRFNNKRAVKKPADPVLDPRTGEEVAYYGQSHAGTACATGSKENLHRRDDPNRYRPVHGKPALSFDRPDRADWQLPGGSLTDRSNRADGLPVHPHEHTPSSFCDYGGGGSRAAAQPPPPRESRAPQLKCQRDGGAGVASSSASSAGATVAARWDASLEPLFAPDYDRFRPANDLPFRFSYLRGNRPLVGAGPHGGGDEATFRVQQNSYSTAEDPKGEQSTGVWAARGKAAWE